MSRGRRWHGGRGGYNKALISASGLQRHGVRSASDHEVVQIRVKARPVCARNVAERHLVAVADLARACERQSGCSLRALARSASPLALLALALALALAIALALLALPLALTLALALDGSSLSLPISLPLVSCVALFLLLIVLWRGECNAAYTHRRCWIVQGDAGAADGMRGVCAEWRVCGGEGGVYFCCVGAEGRCSLYVVSLAGPCPPEGRWFGPGPSPSRGMMVPPPPCGVGLWAN